MKLTLAICSYEPEAHIDHFDDGSFEAFDVVTAEIVEGERAGQQLRILVKNNGPLAERWNRPGKTSTVSVDPDRLATPILFAGAFTIEGES